MVEPIQYAMAARYTPHRGAMDVRFATKWRLSFRHNFGYGQNVILPRLFHTMVRLMCTLYRVIRAHLVARQAFFNDKQTLTHYLCFAHWEHLHTVMMPQLELLLPPDST